MVETRASKARDNAIAKQPAVNPKQEPEETARPVPKPATKPAPKPKPKLADSKIKTHPPPRVGQRIPLQQPSFPPRFQKDTARLQDYSVILIREPEIVGFDVNRRETKLLDFCEDDPYATDKNWYEICGLVNVRLRAIIDTFRKFPVDDPLGPTICEFVTPGLGRRECGRGAPRDYVAAVSEMIKHGDRELVFYIGPKKKKDDSFGQTAQKVRSREGADHGGTRKRQRIDGNNVNQAIEPSFPTPYTDGSSKSSEEGESNDELSKDGEESQRSTEGVSDAESNEPPEPVDHVPGRWNHQFWEILKERDEQEATKQRQEASKRFRRSHDCEEIDQFDNAIWADCCKFFGVDTSVRNWTAPSSFVLPGLKEPLLSHKAYAVCWMLKSEVSLAGGGFLCDENELERREEVLALFAVNRIVARSCQIMEEERENPRRKLHLPLSSVKRQEAGARCPSEQAGRPRFSIACPCVEAGPTATLQSSKRYRPTLLLALDINIQEWTTLINNFLSFDPEPYSNVDPKDEPPLNLSTFQGVAHPDIDAQVLDIIAVGSTKKKILPDGERHLVLMSYGGWAGGMTKAEQARKAKNKWWRPVVEWGRVIKDECHTDTHMKAVTARTLAQLYGKPWLWALSGTPCESRPADLALYVGYLARNAPSSWKDDLRLRQAERISEIDSYYTLLCEWGEPIFNTSIRWFGIMFESALKELMIRRTSSTDWLGSRLNPPTAVRTTVTMYGTSSQKAENDNITKLRENAQWILLKALDSLPPTDKRFQTDSTHITARKNLEPWLRLVRIFRMTTTIPGLARLAIEDNKLLSTVELDDSNWWLRNARSPAKLNELCRSSAALDRLIQILTSVEIRDEKTIVVSEFPIIAHITDMWLRIKGHKSLLIHGDDPNNAKLIRDFDGRRNFKSPVFSEDAANARVLITTYPLLHKCYPISNTAQLIIMEPPLNKDSKLHMIHHIERPKDGTGWVCELRCGDSNTENNILKQQSRRWPPEHDMSFKEPGDAADFGSQEPEKIFEIFKDAIENPEDDPVVLEDRLY